MSRRSNRGFTLVEVLVALVVVAIGLAALMVAVAGVARTSGYLRDKTLAQWIALNRLAEVRLTVNKIASGSPLGGSTINSTLASASSAGPSGVSSSSGATQGGDAGELQFAGRTWHYDTRYFNTSVQSMRRIVVRVWLGAASTKSNPLAESTGFYGAALSLPGNSNSFDWTQGTTAAAPCPASGQTGPGGTANPGTSTANCTPGAGSTPASGATVP